MTRIISLTKHIFSRHRGAVLPLVAILMVVLLGFAAFAIDIGYSYVVKNELQNAADAAALAGASVLFTDNQNCLSSGSPYSCCSGLGTGSCDPGVIDNYNVTTTAQEVASKNYSGGKSITATAVETGHYAFASSWGSPGVFTASTTNQQMTDWSSQKFSDLNGNTSFINAVRATVARTDVPRFFSRIFSSSGITITVQAIAYVGFAGKLLPGEVDQPIAVCKQSILNNDGQYDCTVGRMLNSGSVNTTHNTAGWTNFSQPCQTASANEMNSLICSSGNPVAITLGEGMGATGGVQDVTLRNLHDCMWNDASLDTNGDSIPDQPWTMTLPVIDCDGNNISNCATVTGAVNINILWITEKANDPVPRKMEDWTCDPTFSEEQCWTEFTERFNLKDVDNNTPAYAKKSIYFLPSCTPFAPKGGTGGENYGILARYPVLVK
jgi:hypothetical protein